MSLDVPIVRRFTNSSDDKLLGTESSLDFVLSPVNLRFVVSQEKEWTLR